MVFSDTKMQCLMLPVAFPMLSLSEGPRELCPRCCTALVTNQDGSEFLLKVPEPGLRENLCLLPQVATWWANAITVQFPEIKVWPWLGGSVVGAWALLINVSSWWRDKGCKTSPISPSQPVRAGRNSEFCVSRSFPRLRLSPGP